MANDQNIGVFVAGGPAAGINAVIKGIVEEADNVGINVLGFRDGAQGLVEGRFALLSRQMVEDIDILGGSLLGTSRYRIDSEGRDVARIVENLRREEVGGLGSIGGEGTLQLADHLRRNGVPIVHVPKTIDNDIAGVSQTFGFDTAVHEATRMLTAIKLDAKTTDSWFVVEIMGRNTGHLALEAGLASGATRVLIPEEGPIDVPGLVNLMTTRARCGRRWGVILVAEAAHFGEGPITRYGRLGGISEALAERLGIACQLAGLRAKVRTSNLGYILRCMEPTGYDRSYAAQLGFGAVQFLRDPERCGSMVTVKDDHLVPVRMEDVAGKTKLVELNGVRYKALKAFASYESAQSDLCDIERARAGAPEALHWLDEHATMETVEKVAMRLNVAPEDLLEAIQDLVRVETEGG